MTSSSSTESERKRLERIAEDYRIQGYDAKVQPHREDLPDFLDSFEPDLIVSGQGETIVVEVKTRRELNSVPFPEPLEAALQNRPGWRFELVINREDPELRQTLTASQIRGLLETAKSFSDLCFPLRLS